MLRRALTCSLNRRAWQQSMLRKESSALGSFQQQQRLSKSLPLATAAALAAGSGIVLLTDSPPSVTFCNDNNNDVIMVSNENSEEERFEQCVAYHRCFLQDYRDRWQYSSQQTQTTPSSSNNNWPLHIPLEQEIPALEFDLQFCKLALSDKTDNKDKFSRHYCRDLQFRLACYYLRYSDDSELQMRGFKMMKRLAEQGHGDGMCMYGIVLNEGKLVEANSTQATVWWRRAVDQERHVQSTYELAVAFYTGEGVPESEELAVYYFEKAATLGHAGAAYMLGDCLLDGVGAPRDRAEALEWLVAAGELGHRGARSRVLAVLENDPSRSHGKFTDSSRQSFVNDDEGLKWTTLEDEDGLKEVSVERRFTIGGGSGNPVVLVKRKTVVAESRTP